MARVDQSMIEASKDAYLALTNPPIEIPEAIAVPAVQMGFWDKVLLIGAEIGIFVFFAIVIVGLILGIYRINWVRNFLSPMVERATFPNRVLDDLMSRYVSAQNGGPKFTFTLPIMLFIAIYPGLCLIFAGIIFYAIWNVGAIIINSAMVLL